MGIEVDVNLLGKIDGHLAQVAKSQQAFAEWLSKSTRAARYLSTDGQGTCDTNGYAVIQLNGPQIGRRWVVRCVLVGGLTWGTTAAGSAVLVVQSQAPSTDMQPPLVNCNDQTGTLPNKAFYGHGEVVVGQMQRLWLVVTGGTSTQVYAATAYYVDEEAT